CISPLLASLWLLLTKRSAREHVAVHCELRHFRTRRAPLWAQTRPTLLARNPTVLRSRRNQTETRVIDHEFLRRPHRRPRIRRYHLEDDLHLLCLRNHAGSHPPAHSQAQAPRGGDDRELLGREQNRPD